MPRVGQIRASDDERFTDRIAVGVLTSTFPPGLIDEVLEATGRVVALAECGTHAIIAAEIGPCTTGETTLVRKLFPRLEEGMLLLVDRGFCGYDLWQAAAAGGAQLCWRTKSNAVLPVTELLPDGSYLSALAPPRGNSGKPAVVRVVEYTLDHPSRGKAEPPIRLITTLLDAAEAPAAELAELYGERWEEENAFDELKTHQRGAGRVLRSKSPEMVIQEIYAHLLVYYAIRVLINGAAEPAGAPGQPSGDQTQDVQMAAQTRPPPQPGTPARATTRHHRHHRPLQAGTQEPPVRQQQAPPKH